jgi:hypothetical protein
MPNMKLEFEFWAWKFFMDFYNYICIIKKR